MKLTISILAILLLAGSAIAQSDSISEYQALVSRHAEYRNALGALNYSTSNGDSVRIWISAGVQTFYIRFKATAAQRDSINPVRQRLRDSIQAVKARINNYW